MKGLLQVIDLKQPKTREVTEQQSENPCRICRSDPVQTHASVLQDDIVLEINADLLSSLTSPGPIVTILSLNFAPCPVKLIFEAC